MKGLLLTNYYLIHRSFLTYTALAIVISAVIFYFADPSFYRIIAMLIILLMAMPALEVIKLESKTGYDKYVLTLPISRKNVVQSHYIFTFNCRQRNHPILWCFLNVFAYFQACSREYSKYRFVWYIYRTFRRCNCLSASLCIRGREI